jgi:RNA polymerase sigma-70 factor (ECF subfamily)
MKPRLLPSDQPGAESQISGILRGEASAVDAWYRQEHPQVYRLCFGFLAGASEAEDIAQDAMLHLLDRLDRWDRQRPYRAWRNTVVLNLCRDRLRRNTARRSAEQAAAEHVLSKQLPRPEEEAQRNEVQEILAESLSRLTDREREVFVLRDLEGLSTAESARAMEVAEGTVRSILTLARRRLRNLLGERLTGAAPDPGPGGHRA